MQAYCVGSTEEQVNGITFLLIGCQIQEKGCAAAAWWRLSGFLNPHRFDMALDMVQTSLVSQSMMSESGCILTSNMPR